MEYLNKYSYGGNKSEKVRIFLYACIKETPEEFTTRVAKNVKGARALIETGFEKVDNFDGVHIYRKQK